MKELLELRIVEQELLGRVKARHVDCVFAVEDANAGSVRSKEDAVMPTIEQNRATWDSELPWALFDAGERWSDWWGGTEAQWRLSLLPRISSFVPAPTILEIAPGFGRWTQFLKDRCDQLIIVDLSQRCIDACRQRFAGQANIAYFRNDGYSLGMVPDNSMDFAFSFDSLVHADADVLEGYIGELARVLRPDGVCFISPLELGCIPHVRCRNRTRPNTLSF